MSDLFHMFHLNIKGELQGQPPYIDYFAVFVVFFDGSSLFLPLIFQFFRPYLLFKKATKSNLKGGAAAAIAPLGSATALTDHMVNLEMMLVSP